jgi:hypothetical protein
MRVPKSNSDEERNYSQDQQLRALLTDYIARMGADPKLLDLSDSKELRALTGPELEAYRVHTQSQPQSRFGDLSIQQDDDGQFVSFNGKKVGALAAQILNIERRFELSDRDVFLFYIYRGGTACAGYYRFVTVNSQGPSTSKEFGSCSDLPEITQNGEVIIVQLPGFGEGKTEFSFENGLLTERELPVQLVDLDNFAELVGKHPWESLKVKSVRSKLIAQVGEKQFPQLVRNLTVSDSIKERDGFYFVEGIAPHGGGSEEGALAISIDGQHVFAAFTIDGKIAAEPATRKLPKALYEWLKDRRDR